MIKGSVLQEDITILNIYILYLTTVFKYVRQKLEEWQAEIYKFIIIVGDFNTPLLEMDKSKRQKISKDRVELINAINQLDIKDINRLLYPTRAEYTFL